MYAEGHSKTPEIIQLGRLIREERDDIASSRTTRPVSKQLQQQENLDGGVKAHK